MYMLVTVIVLINLLIAMMSDTYHNIQSQSDIEWKYGLSKLIRKMQKYDSSASIKTQSMNHIVSLFRYNRVIVFLISSKEQKLPHRR